MGQNSMKSSSILLFFFANAKHPHAFPNNLKLDFEYCYVIAILSL
jgi:hypothetical protein